MSTTIDAIKIPHKLIFIKIKLWSLRYCQQNTTSRHLILTLTLRLTLTLPLVLTLTFSLTLTLPCDPGDDRPCERGTGCERSQQLPRSPPERCWSIHWYVTRLFSVSLTLSLPPHALLSRTFSLQFASFLYHLPLLVYLPSFLYVTSFLPSFLLSLTLPFFF